MASSFARFLSVALLAVGMVVFALCSHRPELAAAKWAGLAMAGMGLASCVAQAANLRELLGLPKWTSRLPLALLIAVAFGAAMALAFRAARPWSLLPQTLTLFALVSMAIGISEEFVYRGIVQGSLRRYGALWAVAIASLCHTAYKCSLFALPAEGGPQANLYWLTAGTFAVGLLLGAMRERMGGLPAAAAAHATFDLLCYGDLASAPWWVW